MIDTVSISDLKQNTSTVVKKVKSGGRSIMIIQRSKPAAVLVDPHYYSVLEEALEDLADLKAIEERKTEEKIPFKEIMKKLRAE